MESMNCRGLEALTPGFYKLHRLLLMALTRISTFIWNEIVRSFSHNNFEQMNEQFPRVKVEICEAINPAINALFQFKKGNKGHVVAI